MNNYNNIPLELRQLDQWVVWKDNKVPYDAKTGQKASVNDKNTWSTFSEVLSICNNYNGIGFVFIEQNNLTFMDLDNPKNDQLIIDRQKKIATAFDSYSETSPSGTGLHIIVKGLIPKSEDGLRHGLKRASVEIYSDRRFATFTGNVYNNKAIIDHSNLIVQLWEEMSNVNNKQIININQHQEIEKLSDDKIIEQATNAVNGDIFKALFAGNWQGDYPSCSEADQALIDIIQFYTKNIEQITRIYRMSTLSYTPKGTYKHRRDRKDYILRTIKKSFDRELPLIEQFVKPVASIAQLVEPVPHKNYDLGSNPSASTNHQMNGHDFKMDNSIPYPPGLIGEIADYIYQTAPTPILEIALASALAAMAGITGRVYNVLDNGLNLYMVLIAKSGTGKEWAKAGIEKLVKEIRLNSNGFIPDMDGFIGPRKFASASALMNQFDNQKSFVSIMDEFGLKLQSMLSQEKHINYQNEVCSALLEIYGLSGKDSVCRPSVFADKIKNTGIINSPAVSILGLTTPETFYSAVNEEAVAQGLLPRFMIIEYNGLAVTLNKNRDIRPPQQLMKTLENLIVNCKTINANIDNGGLPCSIPFDAKATKISDEFSEHCRCKNNAADKEAFRQLWSRAHMKALKIAGLACLNHTNYYDPLINPQYLNWAIDRVNFDIEALSAKFESGNIGNKNNEIKQVNEVRRMINNYINDPWDKVKKYSNSERLYNAHIVTYTYLNKRLSDTAAFRHPTMSPSTLLERAIKILIQYDEIRESNKNVNNDKYGTGQRGFDIVRQ